MTEDMEHELASGMEYDLTAGQMAAKLAPFSEAFDPQKARDATIDFATRVADQVGQKRSMVPSEHFSESIATLSKALEDAKSLRNRLIGEPGMPAGTDRNLKGSPAKLPVVGELHNQANEIARIAGEISVVVAQIRGRL